MRLVHDVQRMQPADDVGTKHTTCALPRASQTGTPLLRQRGLHRAV